MLPISSDRQPIRGAKQGHFWPPTDTSTMARSHFRVVLIMFWWGITPLCGLAGAKHAFLAIKEAVVIAQTCWVDFNTPYSSVRPFLTTCKQHSFLLLVAAYACHMHVLSTHACTLKRACWGGWGVDPFSKFPYFWCIAIMWFETYTHTHTHTHTHVWCQQQKR